MHLYDIHVHEPEKPRHIVHPDAGAFPAFALLETKLVDGWRDRRKRAFMEKGFAAVAPHQRQGPAADVFESALADPLPIGGQLVAARHLRVPEEPLNVLARDFRCC